MFYYHILEYYTFILIFDTSNINILIYVNIAKIFFVIVIVIVIVVVVVVVVVV